MKLTVINGDGRLCLGFLPGLALAVHRDLVVDTKLALGHARQVGLHQDLAGDVSRQHLEEYNYYMFCSQKVHFLTWPWGDMRRLTYSITSRKSSFLLYLIPSLLQPI